MRTKLLEQKAQESFRRIMESECRSSIMKDNVGCKEPQTAAGRTSEASN